MAADKSSTLDQRRHRMQAARTAAETSAAAVEVLDQQLRANKKKRRKQKDALKRLREHQAELKRDIEDGKSERRKWQVARNKAARIAAKAEKKAAKAEAKYEKAVLGDVVRKEKKDLVKHPDANLLGVRSP